MKKLIIALLLVMALALPTGDAQADGLPLWVQNMAGNPWGIERPPIAGGDVEFRQTVVQAMDLLQTKDSPHYFLVCEAVAGIEYSEKPTTPNGDKALAYEDGEYIVITSAISKRQNKDLFSPEFMAGLLVHEASHVAQFKCGKGDENRETVAHAHGITALTAVGAPNKLIDHAKKTAEWHLKQLE